MILIYKIDWQKNHYTGRVYFTLSDYESGEEIAGPFDSDGAARRYFWENIGTNKHRLLS